MAIADLDRQVPIDPLAPLTDGAYQDCLVTVRRVGRRGPVSAAGVHTLHFDVVSSPTHLWIEHVLPDDRISNDLSVIIAEELFAPGWLRGSKLFERIFTGVVRTCREDALDAWEVFYRNTLDGEGRPRSPGGGEDATLGPVHDHLMEILPAGSVLDLGSCFGFLPLRIAATGQRITATDSDPSIIDLLGRVASRIGSPLEVTPADARHLPFEDDSFDVVLAVHLLEHLDDESGHQVLVEASRVARHQVVVAVPFEDEPNESYGHVQALTLADVERWGASSGLGHRAYEHHGGWLILDQQ